jgi:hypothetical protein
MTKNMLKNYGSTSPRFPVQETKRKESKVVSVYAMKAYGE